ncbi:SlyX family protein [Pseudoruegeria sp. SK021]|uniref:SlyX family protein n=1 Tax=Pseudoruegeria sp. SK021 TaxID=1933035 RepID=UPI000A224A51|nr:SlyX family protein [Pseudoruegeria sp. SK021]OSP53518.1 SlyX protein [Pseudoruegeria sp. SK021]
MSSTEEAVTRLEEKLAYLDRVVSDLSDVVARQDGEITVLTRRVQMLLQRGAEQELSEGGTVPLADQRPPHY